MKLWNRKCRREVLDGHDPLRWITFNFGKKQFKEIIAFTEALYKKVIWMKSKDNCRSICQYQSSYVEDAPVEETIGNF